MRSRIVIEIETETRHCRTTVITMIEEALASHWNEGIILDDTPLTELSYNILDTNSSLVLRSSSPLEAL